MRENLIGTKSPCHRCQNPPDHVRRQPAVARLSCFRPGHPAVRGIAKFRAEVAVFPG